MLLIFYLLVSGCLENESFRARCILKGMSREVTELILRKERSGWLTTGAIGSHSTMASYGNIVVRYDWRDRVEKIEINSK